MGKSPWRSHRFSGRSYTLCRATCSLAAGPLGQDAGRVTPPTRADLDLVATSPRQTSIHRRVDIIGAVNQLRSLYRALRADLFGSVSPYRQSSTALARLLTVFVVVALVFGAIPGEDTGAVQAANPKPTARPIATVNSKAVRAAAVGNFVEGIVFDDTRKRNGTIDDNEPGLAGVTITLERVDVPSAIACTALIARFEKQVLSCSASP